MLQQLASGASAGLLGSLGAATAWAQAAFPSRPVRVVVPFPAGGSADVIARGVSERLAKAWGQPVVVDNRPGAAGMIGADAVAKAPADGHTLLMTTTTLMQAPSLYGKAPYDPIRDLTAISELATTHLVLAAGPELPIQHVKDLPAHVARLGKALPYGTFGQGSSGHVQMEIFARAAKVPLVHVAYKGENPLVTDLLGGHVPLGTISAGSVLQHSRTGKVRPLAVAGASRSPLLPNVPTFEEAGFAGLERHGWLGLFAPAGSPAPLLERISADVNRALADPAVREHMIALGIALKGSTPLAFAEVVKADQAYWAKAIRDTGIKLD
ncbi:tripartite tricarboxylate transporter substrate binding protein [Ramlibacter solisilvae]